MAIVVVTYNSAHVIEGLLDSVPAALGRLTGRVVVVDNDSRDDTREVVARRPDVRLVRAENRGFAAGINAGFEAAGRVEAVMVLNPDVVLAPDSLVHLYETLQDPRVGIAAPQVRTDTGELHYSLRREPTVRRTLGLNKVRRSVLAEYVNDDQAYAVPHAVEWALGAALLVRRKCFEAVGGWDESFFRTQRRPTSASGRTMPDGSRGTTPAPW